MSLLDQSISTGQISENPYPTYAELRTSEPISWSERWQCWTLSRYADVNAALQDPASFSNSGRVVNAIRREFKGEAFDKVRPLVEHYQRGIVNSDPPDHTRIRRLVQAAFQPRTIERLRPHIQMIVDELLDRVQDQGKMEIIADLSYPLPVRVIAELMGIPVEMQDQFKAWSQGIAEFMSTPRPPLEVALRSQTALGQLKDYFKTVFTERRRQPREDLISDLVNIHLDGQKLTEEELLSTCVSILIGGHETTTTLIASAVLLLFQNPEAMRDLRENPSIGLTATEEFLRYDPPFQRIVNRVAMRDMDLNGNKITKGQTVMLLIGSANRDATVFENPEKLNLRRTPNRHLSFGYGIHFCLGAGLARIEVPAAINSLLRRMPKLALTNETLHWHDGMVRTLGKLPVIF